MEDNNKRIIDMRKIMQVLLAKKKLFYKTLPTAVVLSAIWIFPEPRYYTADVSLAPETVSETAGGNLSAIASSFGVNLGGAQNDAIYPMLYPDLFQSNEFIVSLFNIQVQTEDDEVKCDYYTYMTKHQEHNFLTYPIKKVFQSIIKFFKKKPKSANAGDGVAVVNPFRMSEEDFLLVEGLKNNIVCSVDKKTDVATISVKDQDPLVCALLADSITSRLQDFIVEYRTSKARQDMLYYEEMTQTAKREYEEAAKAYSDYCDGHQNVILQSYMSKRDELENEMALKFNAYNAMSTQYLAAKAKVQEKTPAFTTLKSATVPIKPAGPKRMLFVFGMTFLTFMGTSLWICRKMLFK